MEVGAGHNTNSQSGFARLPSGSWGLRGPGFSLGETDLMRCLLGAPGGGVAGVDFVREANRKEVGLLPNDSVRILFLSFLCLWVSCSSSWEGTSLAPSQHRSCCRTAFQGGVEGTLERPGACTTWPVRVLGGGYPGYPVGGG